MKNQIYLNFQYSTHVYFILLNQNDFFKPSLYFMIIKYYRNYCQLLNLDNLHFKKLAMYFSQVLFYYEIKMNNKIYYFLLNHVKVFNFFCLLIPLIYFKFLLIYNYYFNLFIIILYLFLTMVKIIFIKVTIINLIIFNYFFIYQFN